LPGPEINELGRAAWPVSSSELSKAYRKLSLLVHPDKAPGPEARQAFEQLKQAYNELKDADKLVSADLLLERGCCHAAQQLLITANV
jgi:DnaJ family protein C protein 8